MTEMYDPEIIRAVQQGVTAAVLASTTPELPVKYLGLSFDPPDDQKYLEVVHIPNNANGDFWGDEKNYMGMFRLILHWPVDGLGVYIPVGVLASIASYFRKDVPLGQVQISANPDFMGTLEQGAKNLYPVSVRYQCFRP